MSRPLWPAIASFVAAFLPCGRALAAPPSVEAFAGSVGGVVPVPVLLLFILIVARLGASRLLPRRAP